ncbi:MAG: GxxExxY protein [Gemmataceae bacterium]
MDLLYKEESYRIIGACFEVYKEMGPGFLEAVYQRCLAIELDFKTSVLAADRSPLDYKGHPVDLTYKPDFICFDKIIIEIKAVSELADEHRRAASQLPQSHRPSPGPPRQLLHYPKLEYERVIR